MTTKTENTKPTDAQLAAVIDEEARNPQIAANRRSLGITIEQAALTMTEEKLAARAAARSFNP